MKYPLEKAVFEAKLVEIELKMKADGREMSKEEFLKLCEEQRKVERAIGAIAPIFEVGDGVSIKGYSDVYPYEVIEVSKSGKKVKIREMKAKLDPNWKPEMIPGGFSAHCVNNREQKWILESDEDGAVMEISLRKVKLNPRYNNGLVMCEQWVPVGQKAKIGDKPVLPFAKRFYDYNF